MGIFLVAVLALLAEPFLTYALAREPGQAGTAPDLSGTVWQWQQTLMNNDDKFVPDNPADYTVQFMADGTVAIQADCNRVRGTYTIDGNQLILDETGQVGRETMTYTLSGNAMTLAGNDEQYDFDGDGVEDPATFMMVLARQ